MQWRVEVLKEKRKKWQLSSPVLRLTSDFFFFFNITYFVFLKKYFYRKETENKLKYHYSKNLRYEIMKMLHSFKENDLIIKQFLLPQLPLSLLNVMKIHKLRKGNKLLRSKCTGKSLSTTFDKIRS